MARVSENRLATSLYNEEEKTLLIVFKGVVKENLAKDIFTDILNFSSKNEVRGILADLRNLRGTFMKFMDYFEDEAYPLLIKEGLKAEAIIIPEDDLIVENLSVKLRSLLKKLGLKCELFTTPEEAKRWLNDQVR